MSVTIEVFYSFQSPYSYVALEDIYEIENNYDVEVLWQPYSAKAAGIQVPASPVVPEKLSYLIEDTKRLAEERNMPLVFPESWPEAEYDPTRVTRGALAAKDLGVLMEYNCKVFDKWWGSGEDPNDEEFQTSLCEELDVDLGEFLSKLQASDTRERVRGVHKRGRKLGVFDTPTLIYDKQRFYGVEKIQAVKARLDVAGLRK